MNFSKLVAASAAVALAAVSIEVIAQDDLDDLLNDLEGGVSQQGAIAVPAEPQEEPVAGPEAEPVVPDAVAAPESPEAPAAEPDAEPEDPAADPAVAESVPEPEVPGAEAVPESGRDDLIDLMDELVAETPPVKPGEPVSAGSASSVAPEAEGAVAPESAVQGGVSPDDPNAEILSNIAATERLRRRSYDAQARREIQEARKCMRAEEYMDAARHYHLAEKYLGGAPANEAVRRECRQGVAEGLYRAALQEDSVGRRERAVKLMKKALDCRHPKARRQLAVWKDEIDPESARVDVTDLRGRFTDPEYVAARDKINRHLRRARQFYGTKELEKALNECELVLLDDSSNQAAIRLREKIERKIGLVASQERRAAREGMIADVEIAWRPAYGVKAKESLKSTATTTKTGMAEDPERTQEQITIARMKAMKIPEPVTFKPPATINDAVEYFRTASVDYDDPQLPESERGFGFIMRGDNPVGLSTKSDEPQEGFGAADDTPQVAAGPGAFTAPFILPNPTFYDALSLVCEVLGYQFRVDGKSINVMPKGFTIDTMDTRRYPVQSTFVEKMKNAAGEAKDSGGFGGGQRAAASESSDETEGWKLFLNELYDIQWPEGSSIRYLESLGRLYVKNTKENLAKLELALEDMNAEPRLIEIEARFVEVCQEDLNSLGFEWILNSDYTLSLPRGLARALNIKRGGFGKSDGTLSTSSSSGDSSSTSTVGGGITSPGGTTVQTSSMSGSSETVNTQNRTFYANSNGASWIRDGDRLVASRRNMGINGFGGNSDYGTGQRYLSTLSNHISGESNSTNDRFMRINAFLGSADLSMILHMLSQRSDTDLLSAPKVLTKSGEQAMIKVVTEYRYPDSYNVQLQSSSSSSSSNGGSQSAILAVVEPQEFKTRDVGVKLEVTPTLVPELNIIDLALKTEVVDEPTWKNYGMKIPFTGNSSLQNFEGIGDIFSGLASILDTIGEGISSSIKEVFAETAVSSATSALDNLTRSSTDNMTYYDAPMEQPFFHIRAIESSVTVFPGSTIVMGGLITEQRKAMDDKIPFLGDLPFIGRLFRSHSEWTNKRNLLIFLSTRLIDTHGRDATLASTEDAQSSPYGVIAAPKAEN